MRVRYTPRAFLEREAIFDYLEERSPKGALNVQRAIARTIRALHQRQLREGAGISVREGQTEVRDLRREGGRHSEELRVHLAVRFDAHRLTLGDEEDVLRLQIQVQNALAVDVR